MSKYEKNKIKARYCLNCISLHIGIEVDHNHCEDSSDLWHEKRANGHHRNKCMYKKKGK